MFEPNIESNIICPKCGWTWMFNDMAYVHHSSEWGMQMSCPKCKNKFRVRKEDTKYTHKPSNSNIVIKEVEETKKKILSLMERMERTSQSSYENDKTKNKYKIVAKNTRLTDASIALVTLQNGYKQTYHIVEDDHCYVLMSVDNETNNIKPSAWIFPEAVEAIKALPPLSHS